MRRRGRDDERGTLSVFVALVVPAVMVVAVGAYYAQQRLAAQQRLDATARTVAAVAAAATATDADTPISHVPPLCQQPDTDPDAANCVALTDTIVGTLATVGVDADSVRFCIWVAPSGPASDPATAHTVRAGIAGTHRAPPGSVGALGAHYYTAVATGGVRRHTAAVWHPSVDPNWAGWDTFTPTCTPDP